MTHPLAQMPQYWGWIPHLDISFQRTVPEFEFADTLRELMGDFPNGVCVNVRDHQTKGSIPSFDGTVRLTFSNLDRFHYDDGSSLIAEVSLGPEHRDVVSTSVSMMSDGIMHIVVDSIKGPQLERLEQEDGLRIIVREVYFLLKKLFHNDLFNESEDLFNSSMSIADDTLSIVRASDREEAVSNIYDVFLQKIDLIAALDYDEVHDIIESERMAHGYRFFAEGFIRACAPKEDVEDMLTVIDLKYRAVKAVKDNSLDRKSVFMQDIISRYTFPVWIVTLIISVLAGSLFSEILTGGHTGSILGLAIVVVIASLAMVFVIALGFLRMYRKHHQSCS